MSGCSTFDFRYNGKGKFAINFHGIPTITNDLSDDFITDKERLYVRDGKFFYQRKF